MEPTNHKSLKNILRWWPSKPHLWEVLTAVLLFVLTYPVIEPDYGCGLDASYVWAFNWLFDNDYNTLTRLIYPYGPFLWLKMPALQGCHFVVFLIFFFVVKCFFVWQGLDLARRNGCGFLPALVFIIPGCVLANIDVFLVFDVAFVVILWLEKQRWTWFATASVMAVFTMMIKVSIGIQTCSILFVGWVIAIFEHRNLRQTAWAALSAVASVLLVGLAVYRSFPTMIQAYVGIPHLVTGYSDALVLMPEHKLWSMLLFLVATATLMVLANSKRARWLSLLMIIPLFAFWKYSIVREDFWHFKQLIAFSSCFLLLLPLCMERRIFTGLCSGLLALTMLFVNLNSLRQDSNSTLSTVRPSNFCKLLANGKTYNAEWQSNVDRAMASRLLDSSVLQQIGTSTVDCYPWEDVFIIANNLNWQPSTAVQFGAGNSPWVNHLAAQNYSNDASAVDFVLFHKGEFRFENGLQSLDGRYMLNDEPEVIDSLLTNYNVIDTGWYGLLLTKGRNGKMPAGGVVEQTIACWEKWISVPQTDGFALRADIQANVNLNGWLRAVFYKPDICFVDYRFDDGREVTYRFSPSTAKGGLWVGPMPLTYAELTALINSNISSPQPVAIRLRAKHPNWHKEEITVCYRKTIQW